MKWFRILLFLLVAGCANDYEFKVGMKVTNGYCEGTISQVYPNLKEAAIVHATCGNIYMSLIFEKLKNLKEIK